MKKEISKKEKGITLIALVVTIVVLIILATVSINAVLGQNGIIGKAKQAKESYEKSVKAEDAAMQDLLEQMEEYEEGITATIDGKKIKITKDNVADYLGKVVTNYKPTATTVTVGSNTYTVSNNYRLYYIDFDKKYNKDEVSVFLKADCTDNFYDLVQDTTSADASNIKIKELNPSLYKDGVTSPDASQENMQAVTWLLNTSNWSSLKTGASLEDKVNYVVGAPSVEMMMDSYNTKYGLTGDTPDTSALSESTSRVKLFYKYPYDSSNYGYGVGPCNYESTVKDYYYYTSQFSVKTDSEIDSMYYPGDSQYYWLASPAANNANYMLIVLYYNGGRVSRTSHNDEHAFCPLISLKSSASLELQ